MKLVIYGAGGLGREVLWLLRMCANKDHSGGPLEFIGFIDDGIPAGTRVGDAAVLGGIDWLSSPGAGDEPLAVVMGIANPSIKASLYEKLSKFPKIKFPVLVHPSACVAPSASLADGTVICAFCHMSVDTVFGICSFFNSGALVGHDTVIGDFCSVMSSVNISGSITIGTRTLIGAGAKIFQGRKIGSNSTVGLGSVVVTNVPDNCTVIASPAKML